MTVPDRLDILRHYAPEVAWHFSPTTLQFIGVRGSDGVKCTIGKDTTKPSIMRLAIEVQSQLRGVKNGRSKRQKS